MEQSLEALKDAAIIGAGAAVYQNATDYAFEMTALNDWQTGLIQGLGGLAVCAGLGATELPRVVAVTVGVGAMVAGLRKGVLAIRHSMMTAAPATTPPPGATPGAAAAAPGAAPGSLPAPGAQAPASRVMGYSYAR